MSYYVVAGSELAAIADAIRSKAGTSAGMTLAGMAAAVGGIRAVPDLTTPEDFAFHLYGAATSVAAYEFDAQSRIASVRLPACTSVGDDAFACCESLGSLDIPACATIGTYAFHSCEALEEVSLPACTSIGDNAFAGCVALETVRLGPNVAHIGDGAFETAGLRAIVVPTGTLGRFEAGVGAVDWPYATYWSYLRDESGQTYYDLYGEPSGGGDQQGGDQC